MPTTEFETALTERIEFAVFVAYEQWVRASNYVAINPYDVLARLLPALPESLSQAASSRGGWEAFDPVNGLPADEARQLISEMAAQVVRARIVALAADAPQADLLATVIVEAINRTVTVFVEDPENWRLAMSPGERAPLAALGEAPGAAAGEDLEAVPHGLPPPAAEVAEAGEDYGAATSRIVQAVESVGRAEVVRLLGVSELWFIKGAGSLAMPEASAVAAGLLVDFGPVDQLDGSSEGSDAGTSPSDRGDPRGEGGGMPTLPSLPTDPSPEVRNPIDPRYNLPADVAAVIDKWFALLSKAKFYRVQEDGSVYQLNPVEASAIVDTLITVLVRRAQLELALPKLPGEPAPAGAAPAAAAAAAPAETDIAPAPEPAVASGLGSDTLALPPPSAPASGAEVEVAVLVPPPAADPVPDGLPVNVELSTLPPVLPPLPEPGADPWTI